MRGSYTVVFSHTAYHHIMAIHSSHIRLIYNIYTYILRIFELGDDDVGTLTLLEVTARLD